MAYFSYSQNFEDYRLHRALSDITNGTYIDIGAWEPQYHSVSYNFYERGWRGLNAEPEKQSFEMLLTSRPKDINVNKFVTTKTEPINFYSVAKSGLSTNNLDLLKQERIGKPIEIQRGLVETVSLDSLFNQLSAHTIHWLKIDVEGSENEVIESWGENSARPWILVVESTIPGSQILSDKKWESRILSKGYNAAYFDGLNTFYTLIERKDLALKLSKPISIFDNAYKIEHHINREIIKILTEKTDLASLANKSGYLDEPSFEISARNAKLILDENLNLKKEIEEIQAQNLSLITKLVNCENAYNGLVNAKIFIISYTLRNIYFKFRRFNSEGILRKTIIYLAFFASTNPSIKKFILKIISPQSLYKLKKIIRNETFPQKNPTNYQKSGVIDYKLNRIINK